MAHSVSPTIAVRGELRGRVFVKVGVLWTPRHKEKPQMEPFRPSIDCGHAVVDSLLWVAKAWSISACCAVVALALVRLLTPWGRRFWRITGMYFSGVRSIPTWLMLGVPLLSVIVGVRLNVLFSYQDNDLYSAVQVAFRVRPPATKP